MNANLDSNGSCGKNDRETVRHHLNNCSIFTTQAFRIPSQTNVVVFILLYTKMVCSIVKRLAFGILSQTNIVVFIMYYDSAFIRVSRDRHFA